MREFMPREGADPESKIRRAVAGAAAVINSDSSPFIGKTGTPSEIAQECLQAVMDAVEAELEEGVAGQLTSCYVALRRDGTGASIFYEFSAEGEFATMEIPVNFQEGTDEEGQQDPD